MGKAVPASTEFRGGGRVLEVDEIQKGERFFRITLAEPINVGVYPGKDKVNQTITYKEGTYKYVDAPLSDFMSKWYQNEMAKGKPLFMVTKLGCALFIPSSNMASVNLRTSYPGKFFLFWQKVLRAKNMLLIVAAFVAHLYVLISCQ